MKPRLLGLLAGLSSLGFGWWLIAQPHTSREIFLCMVAWVLGFWVASGVRGPAGPASPEDPEAAEDDPD